MKIKRWIKEGLLRQGYRFVRSMSPAFAEKVKQALKERLLVSGSIGARAVMEQFFAGGNVILFDTTQLSAVNDGSGVPRVVKNILMRLAAKAPLAAVREEYGLLVTNEQYLQGDARNESAGKGQQVVAEAGSVLFLPDTALARADSFRNIIRSVRHRGVKTAAIIYDLLPMQIPEFFRCQSDIDGFTQWHRMILSECDMVLCISETVARAVEEYCIKEKITRSSPLAIYSFHLGADLPVSRAEAREELLRFVHRRTTFLMVGTVEPRKGHKVAIAAIRRLQKKGLEVQLLILGHPGWSPKLNKEVEGALDDTILWLKDASDAELTWGYQHTRALIAASRDEGFGLPLIEAAHFGLPILCSDIPIFREVTQGYADFFPVMDDGALAEAMADWLKHKSHPNTRQIPRYTWDESAQEILRIVYGKDSPIAVFDGRR